MAYENHQNRPYDEFGCFHIRDFMPGCALIIMIDGKRVRAVVSDVSREMNLIGYIVAGSDKTYWTGVNQIVFLDNYTQNWLDGSE